MIYKNIRENQLLWILVSGFSLMQMASCTTKDIDVKPPAYTPGLVINSYTQTNDSFRIGVTKSIPIVDYDERQKDMEYMANATVTISSGDGTQETLKYDVARHQYISDMKAVAGQTYRLQVSAPSFKTVEAVTTAPEPVSIQTLERIPKIRKNRDGEYQDEIRLTFTDPPAPGDRYIIRTKGLYNSTNASCMQATDASIDQTTSTDDDLSFSEEGCYKTKYGLFITDALFNGKTKALSIFILSDRDSSAAREIELLHVTNDYYRFVRSIKVASEGNEDPFSEPLNIFSNVQNGYGVFSVGSSDLKKLPE